MFHVYTEVSRSIYGHFGDFIIVLPICLLYRGNSVQFVFWNAWDPAIKTSPTQKASLLLLSLPTLANPKPCASVSKRGNLVQSRSCENNFDFKENEPIVGTSFHMNGFARRLVLTRQLKATRKCPNGSNPQLIHAGHPSYGNSHAQLGCSCHYLLIPRCGNLGLALT